MCKVCVAFAQESWKKAFSNSKSRDNDSGLAAKSLSAPHNNSKIPGYKISKDYPLTSSSYGVDSESNDYSENVGY